MPVVTSEGFLKMLTDARAGKYAYASINVTSSSTANAALAAFAESNTDGILQISTGGGEFMSGPAKDSVLGAISLAEHIHRVAERLPVNIAVTSDHCVQKKVETFLLPLLSEAERRRKAGLPLLFQAHMYDGSELPMAENLKNSAEYLKRAADLGIVLEVEVGLVGGEEDGIDNSGVHDSKLYTTPEDMVAAHEALSPIGPYMLAATFGNVHGVYKPGNVKLEPKILRAGQAAVRDKFGSDAFLVFHGGSGSLLEEIHETLEYGVVKMNVDTDCQYAYTRPVADHVFKHYDGVLRIDGEMGDKKQYDPRTYMKRGEAGMSERVKRAAEDLRSLGRSTFRG